MYLFNRIPFLRILIFLVGGILIERHTSAGFSDYVLPAVLFLSLAFFLFIFYRFWQRHYSLRWIPGLLTAGLFVLTGLILSQHQTPQKTEAIIATEVVGIVRDIAFRDDNRIRIVLQPEAFEVPNALRQKDKLLLMVQGPINTSLHEGDRLLFKGEIRPLPTSTNPDAFDYGRYLQNNGFSGQVYLNANDIFIEPSRTFDYRLLPNKIRNACLSVFRNSGVSESALVILQALLLGDRSQMDRETQDSFIKSGAIHLLAVSGLHVGILYMLLGSFLSLFFKPSNTISILLSLGFLFAYAFITGFSPSVSRAALMFAVIHIGRATNRSTNIYNSLAVSASLLIIINPLFLFHVGFWLSHLAVLGIVVFYPLINGLLTFRFMVWRHLWSLIAVSLSAQITTLPVSLYTFGAFPTWFLLSNIILLPLVAPVLLLAIANLFFAISPFLSAIFAGGLNDMLVFMTEMAAAIEGLPKGYIEHLWLSFPLVIISYIVIHQFARLCHQRNGKYWIGLATALIALIAGLNIQLLNKLNSEQLVVYNTRQGLLIDVIKNGRVLTLQSEGLNQQIKSYARNGYIKQYRKHHQPSIIRPLKNDTVPEIHEIKLDSERILIIYGTGGGTIVPPESYKANVIVISSSADIDLQQLIDKTNCKTIVAAPTCPYPLIEKWKKEAANCSVTIHPVRELGAFISQNK